MFILTYHHNGKTYAEHYDAEHALLDDVASYYDAADLDRAVHVAEDGTWRDLMPACLEAIREAEIEQRERDRIKRVYAFPTPVWCNEP
jgi:hypothetical protein